MKNIALLALSLVSLGASAEEVTIADVARLMMNVEIAKLDGYPRCNDRLLKATATPVSDGVTSYELTFIPGNFCEPKQATVTIVEDVTATRHDGPKTYKTSLSVTDLFSER